MKRSIPVKSCVRSIISAAFDGHSSWILLDLLTGSYPVHDVTNKCVCLPLLRITSIYFSAVTGTSFHICDRFSMQSFQNLKILNFRDLEYSFCKYRARSRVPGFRTRFKTWFRKQEVQIRFSTSLFVIYYW